MHVKLSRPKSLTALALERIRADIVHGRLAFGEQISESALAARLGISKTPVREALLRLKVDGLVEIHPQRGTFVFRVGEDEVARICRFREVLESAALAEAIGVARSDLVARLQAVVAAMEHARRGDDHADLPQYDADFHGAILALCGNDYLRAAYGLVEHKVQALRWRLPPNSEQVAHCEAEHAAIIDQIRVGSVARAQASLRKHIRETHDAYVEASRAAAGARQRRA